MLSKFIDQAAQKSSIFSTKASFEKSLMKTNLLSTSYLSHKLWDLWCICSIIGIWPRFIEPHWISLTELPLTIRHLPHSLEGLRIVQFSDLHLNDHLSDGFLDRLSRKINTLSPDILVFTGDFICYSHLTDPDRLKKFLRSLSATYGCYAILGNHDYEEYVSINDNGEYDVVSDESSTLIKGFFRLFNTTQIKKIVTNKSQNICLKQDLINLLEETPFKLLHNDSTTVPIKDSALNICGLGEHMLGRCNPHLAYKNYNEKYPGIVLLHNPDGTPYLSEYPGDIILCGHTHGMQINLPWISDKCTLVENKSLRRGLCLSEQRKVYVNRGIGSTIPFRWFSPPEVLLLTLKSG